jgi:hypothetical protein
MKQQSGNPATPRAAARKPAPSAAAQAKPATAPDDQGDGTTRKEAIRLAAYGFYEARGRVDGHELEDWLRAEAEVSRAQSVDVAAPAQPSH